jgi:hypothetical protein
VRIRRRKVGHHRGGRRARHFLVAVQFVQRRLHGGRSDPARRGVADGRCVVRVGGVGNVGIERRHRCLLARQFSDGRLHVGRCDISGRAAGNLGGVQHATDAARALLQGLQNAKELRRRHALRIHQAHAAGGDLDGRHQLAPACARR